MSMCRMIVYCFEMFWMAYVAIQFVIELAVLMFY